MGVYLSMLMIIPIIIGVVGLFWSKGRICWKEFLVMQGACIFVISVGYLISQHTGMSDVEVWSGRITNKAKEEVPCSHSYSCNCRTVCHGTGKDRSCHTECDTCYEHHRGLRTIRGTDFDWDIYTSDAGRMEIERIDRRGVDMPPRWGAAFIGEPTSSTHSYTNYIKANPTSILRREDALEKWAKHLPAYPNNVYDYYRLNRLVSVGFKEPRAKDWNWLLNELNADMGPKKQANVVVVLAKTPDSTYEYAIEQHWLGGKKNDVVVIIGVPAYPKIGWVRIVSWTDSQAFKVRLRDRIQEIGTVDKRDDIIKAIRENTDQYFVRKSMDDFKYLMSSSQPGPVGTSVLFILGILLCGWLSWYFYHEDPFVTHYGGRHNRRYGY